MNVTHTNRRKDSKQREREKNKTGDTRFQSLGSISTKLFTKLFNKSLLTTETDRDRLYRQKKGSVTKTELWLGRAESH